MLLNFFDKSSVARGDEINGGSLSTISTGSSDSVDIVFLLEWKLIVNNKTNLLNINTSGQ
jgi:hypothetical protein